LTSTMTPAARLDYFQRLLAIREDAHIRRVAQTRAGDIELAEDALQQTFDAMARIKDPSGIEDLRAYFCRVLIRVIIALRGQLRAILPDDLAALADAAQGKSRGHPLPRPVDEAVATNLLTQSWLERFDAERESLAAAVPGRSPDPGRYRQVIVIVAERVLRAIVASDVCDADGDLALRAAYPEWFAADGSKASNVYQRFSRARADVRGLLRKIVSRDDLYQ